VLHYAIILVIRLFNQKAIVLNAALIEFSFPVMVIGIVGRTFRIGFLSPGGGNYVEKKYESNRLPQAVSPAR
jgi:hypothetical protein